MYRKPITKKERRRRLIVLAIEYIIKMAFLFIVLFVMAWIASRIELCADMISARLCERLLP